MTMPHHTSPRNRLPRTALAVAAALFLLVPLAPVAQAVPVPSIPPIHIITVPPVTTEDVDIVFDLVSYVLANTHLVPCADGLGESVDFAGTGVEACVAPGPNGGTCVRVRSFSGADLTRDQACSDRDAGGRDCVSYYHASVVVADDRTCAGNYPDGLCAANTVLDGYLENRACLTSDEYGNLCVAHNVDQYGSNYAQGRTCLGNYPEDGYCSANRGTVSNVAAEGRACLSKDQYGNDCATAATYLNGGFVGSDSTCAGPHGSDGYCGANHATLEPDRRPDADVRACQVHDGSDPCVQEVAYTYGPSEAVRDRTCVRLDGAGAGQPCVTNDVLTFGAPLSDQGACLVQTAEGATCALAWIDGTAVLLCTYGSAAGQCVSAQSGGGPDYACVATSTADGGCVVATTSLGTYPVCGDAVLGGDDDGDNVPDLVEALLCGSQLAEDLFNEALVPGSCNGPGDYEPEDLQPIVDEAEALRAQAVAIVFGAAAEAQRIADEAIVTVRGIVDPLVADVLYQAGLLLEEAMRQVGVVLGIVDEADSDDDGVPQALEPTLCQVENRNLPYDGTCVGSDYSPPA